MKMDPRLLILLCLIFLGTTLASIGDRLPEFESCVKECGSDLCPETTTAVPSSSSFSKSYRNNVVLRHLWSCEADCKYQCVHRISDTLSANNQPLVQFYGKWPFYRVLGVQEFFSMLFLLANLYTNGRNWTFLVERYKSCKGCAQGYDLMYLQYLILIAVSVIGWALSAIFHSRDTAITETLDYFGAFAIVCLNLNIVVTRYFNLFRPYNRRARYVWRLSVIAGYCIHLAYLVHDWDYSRNTMVSVVIGIIALTLWILHSLNVSKYCRENSRLIESSPSCAAYEGRVMSSVRKVPIVNRIVKRYPNQMRVLPIYLNLMLLLGLSLELLDFVPFSRLVDAHSLWHLITLFAPLVWYDWNAWDVELLRHTTV